MSEASLTPEQKEVNKNYILANLDKYIIDASGNFFNVDPELLGGDNEDNIFCYIGREALTPEGIVEIQEKMVDNILSNINDWELVLYGGRINFRNKKTRIEINGHGWGSLNCFETRYLIIGEMGYRENIWANYEEMKKKVEEDRKWKKARYDNSSNQSNNNQTSEQPKTKPDSQTEQESQNQKKPNSTSQNNNTPDQSNPTPNQEPQEQPTNNPLPSPETIQENYNNDKDKSTIENNSNSTTPEQKEQSEALLKLIIEAEFLIKNNQFNPETLSKLLKEKEQNAETYQLLKERIEQAINELSNLEQKNNNSNNEPTVNKQPTMGSAEILAICGVIGVVSAVSLAVIKKIKKLRKPLSKNK